MDTDLLAWEKSLITSNFLPHLDEDTIGDADYLIARVRQIMARADRARAVCQADHDHAIAGAVAHNILIDGFDSLADELRYHTRDADDMFALLQRSYPDMVWYREPARFVGHEHPHTLTPGQSATLCARRLRLRAIEASPDAAPRHWRGTLDMFQVHVNASQPRRHDATTALSPDVVAWLVANAPGLPPIHWQADTHYFGPGPWEDSRPLALRGEVFGFLHPDPAAVARRWAKALGLGRASGMTESGRRRYLGQTEIGLVLVEWVADQRRNDAFMAELDARDTAKAQ